MVEIDCSEDRRKFTLFSGWLKTKGFLTDKYELIPYELSDMFLEETSFGELAKEKAEEIFNSHYFVLFTSETECAEECIVSILAKKAALVTVGNMVQLLEHIIISCKHDEKTIKLLNFYDKVQSEIEKL